jgi:hypothetical protein
MNFFDRASSESCAAVLYVLFPNTVQRTQVLLRLLQSIQVAEIGSPDAWSATLSSDYVRLNVGGTEVLCAGRSGYFLNCAGQYGTPPFVGEDFEPADYDSVADPHCRWRGSLDRLPALPQTVVTAHKQFVLAAGVTRSGRPWKSSRFANSHSTGLVDLARAAAIRGDTPEGPQVEDDEKSAPTTQQALLDARIGQGRFRTEVGTRSGWQCAVTGLSTRAALRASHILPWSMATDQQRLDPDNGLLLAASVDALFDLALITFTPTGTLQISRSIGPDDRYILNLADLRSVPSGAQATYLKIHNEAFRRAENGEAIWSLAALNSFAKQSS